MKKTLALLFALALCLSLCACGGETLPNQSSTPETPTAEATLPTGTSSISEADERDEVVTKFLVGFATQQKDLVAECVPCDEMRDYVWEIMDNAEVVAETIEVTLGGEKGGVECVGDSEKVWNSIRKEFTNVLGVTLDIEEVYVYYGISYTATLIDGGTLTKDDSGFIMFVVKIDGAWYAMPESL